MNVLQDYGDEYVALQMLVDEQLLSVLPSIAHGEGWWEFQPSSISGNHTSSQLWVLSKPCSPSPHNPLPFHTSHSYLYKYMGDRLTLMKIGGVWFDEPTVDRGIELLDDLMYSHYFSQKNSKRSHLLSASKALLQPQTSNYFCVLRKHTRPIGGGVAQSQANKAQITHQGWSVRISPIAVGMAPVRKLPYGSVLDSD